jgi:hypothetical protein
MVAPLTPKPTRKAEALARAPPTIAAVHEGETCQGETKKFSIIGAEDRRPRKCTMEIFYGLRQTTLAFVTHFPAVLSHWF